MAAETSLAIEFLSAYYPPGTLWTVIADREIDGGRGHWLVCQHDPQAQDLSFVRLFIDRHYGRSNLYFAVNSIAPNVRTTPEEADVLALLSVPLDVDLPAGYSQEDLDELLARINAIEPPPTYTMFSGGGVQGGWLLTGPKPLTYLPAVQEMVLALAKELGGDHVQNPNRVMRLPFTPNVLNAAKRARGRQPADTHLIEAHWDRRYEPISPRVPLPSISRYSVESLDAEWQERAQSSSPNWLTGEKRSRSEAVWRFVCHLIQVGWPDRAIIRVLLDRNLGISEHIYDQKGRSPERYAERQVKNARISVERGFQRTARGAIIANRMDNVVRALAQLNISMTYDEFSGQITWVNGEDRGAQLLDDPSVNRFRYECLTQFNFQPPKDTVFDAISVIARESSVHPVKEYLDSLIWDGVPRLETWLIDHGQARDSTFVRAVSRLFLVAAVTRVYRPGATFHEMLVLENPVQGTDKSGSIRALCPDQEWFTSSVDLTSTQREALENLSGKWIVEVAELSGIKQRDVEGLKSFLDKEKDRARMAYDRTVTERHRTCVFFGTTNSLRYLRDEENRRFWPVRVGRMNPAAIAAIRDQLWAEAVVAYRSGESIRLDPALWAEAALEQEERRIEDPWLLDLQDALHGFTGRILTVDLFRILGLDRLPSARTQEANYRVGSAMRQLGWERRKGRDAKDLRWFYVRGGTDAQRRRDLLVRRDPITHEILISYADELLANVAAADIESRDRTADLPY